MKKLGFWLMLGLLLVNIATITTIIIHIRTDKPVITKNQAAFTQVLDTELGFNSHQLLVYKELNEVFVKETSGLTLKMREIRVKMMDELNTSHPDTSVLNQYARDIGDLHCSLKQLTFNHFLEVKKMCTPEQKEKLSILFDNLMQCEGPFNGRGQGKGYRWRHRGGKIDGGGN